MGTKVVELSADRFDAVIFDMDGVITDTASTHMAAWKKLFDDELQRRAGEGGASFEEFTEEDYRRYVDGKPRYDGVRDFLVSVVPVVAVGPAVGRPVVGVARSVRWRSTRPNRSSRRAVHFSGSSSPS